MSPLCHILSLFFAQLEGSSKLKDGLPEDCLLACVCAVSQLRNVFEMLQERKVTLLDLQKIRSKQPQMKELCEAASKEKNEANRSGENAVDLTYEEMNITLKQRLEEIDSFEEQRGILFHLCLKIHDEIKGKINVIVHC